MASIKRTKIADAVLDEIRRRCLNGELKEGDKLPNQNEFAAQLGVSRPSLREALHTLNLVGAIEQRPGFGTVLRSCAPILYANQFSPPLMSDHQATLELVVFRRFIELGTVELAVQNATQKEIRRMGSLVAKMRKALDQGRSEDYTGIDVDFHFAIAEAAHNRFMLHQAVTVRGFLEQFMRESFSVLPGMLERSFKFHQEIYRAIDERNLRKAKSQMSRHIQDIQRGLERYYKLSRKP